MKFPPLLFTLSGIALLLADAGKAEQATEVYASAARHPFLANSRWFRDIAGAELAAVVSQLPLPAAEAAHARGQAADPWQVAADWLETLGTSAVQSGSSVSDNRRAEPGAGFGV